MYMLVYIYVYIYIYIYMYVRACARAHTQVSGDFADVFDGVGAQLGEFDVVTCFGKLN